MNNYNYGFPQQATPTTPTFSQLQQIQQMFPQPQGSVYSINAPVDIGNVPIGSTGLSVALCLPEQLMYIKSFQNGAPVIMAYRVSPFQREERPVDTSAPAIVEDPMASRITALETKINKIIEGGKFDGLL